MVVLSYGTKLKTGSSIFFSQSFLRCSYDLYYRSQTPLQWRTISSTAPFGSSWKDTLKGVFEGSKLKPDWRTTAQTFTIDNKGEKIPGIESESFIDHTFLFGGKKRVYKMRREDMPKPEEYSFYDFADLIHKVRIKKERSNELIRGELMKDVLKKQEQIYRYFAKLAKTEKELESIDKQNAASSCHCSLVEVENALLKFTLAKRTETELQRLLVREGPKTLPINKGEARQFVVEQIDPCKPCPCGSKKIFKRCCGAPSRANTYNERKLAKCPAFFERE